VLEMASDWLRMIQKVDPSASDKFDAAEKGQGINQERSEGEHLAVGKAAIMFTIAQTSQRIREDCYAITGSGSSRGAGD